MKTSNFNSTFLYGMFGVHHECQNVLLKFIALNIQRKIAGVQQNNKFLTIMVDE